jgi:biotin carboxyl carrier protein
MKLSAELSGSEHSLSLAREGERLSAHVDGRTYELTICEREDNQYLLIDGSKVYDSRIETTRDNFMVHLREQSYPIRIIDPKRLRSTQSTGRHDHGSADIVAPMPGKVVRILVEEGEEVASGKGILIVEAMKMQNELKTPKAGIVVSIRAEAGATVNAGDVLAVVE